MSRSAFFLMISFLFVASGCAGTGQPGEIPIKNSRNRERASVERFLEEALLAVERAGDTSVAIRTTGAIYDAAGQSEFELEVSEALYRPLDDHGSISYSRQEITDEGIIIAYKNEAP